MPKSHFQNNQKKVYGYLAFIKLNQIICYDDNVGNTAKKIFGILLGHINQKGECWPSISKIAETLEISRTAVIKQIKILIEHGYLIKKARYDSETNARRSNIYLFNLELAQMYASNTTIFSRKNVTIVVTYLVTLLSYGVMLPNEFTNHETSGSYIKKTKKKTELRKHIKEESDLKKAMIGANEWERNKQRKKNLGISEDQEKRYSQYYEELKELKTPGEAVIFDTRVKKSLETLPQTERFEKLLSIYKAKVDKLNSAKRK